ncbi:probable 3-hydroxyisobutyrate dehydrogenase-like 2, mitochondrial [Lotus japonicus]|uniref:probable 3-hydroxyisobutyrate dehydrogenase-like 2, mitochondrial n=1 Tax=Lotus japonicus TaxID=34305 RepID=UPI0025867E15|nr:probable 3-hydroxyisobutyrate dehydrogenase-like 2, mitochondrial [Lotus japonicus]
METCYPNPIAPTKTRIGWIGIGVMGGAMASRLLNAGYSVTIYARNPSKCLPLQSQGAHVANSPAQVAHSSDVVFTMLSHPPDVRSVVLENTDSVLSGLAPDRVTVDMTSSHPGLAREIFTAARARGCWSVDAPVSGGDHGARDGKLAIFAAGECAVVKWLQSLFEILGKVTYMGQAGCGQSCKIANQITVASNLVGLSEGLVFADKAGLDLKQFMGAIRGGAAGSKALDLFGERMIEKNWGGADVGYMVKDLGMGVDVVEKGEDDKVVVLPGASMNKQLFSSMVAIGNGMHGPQGLITVIETINGK